MSIDQKPYPFIEEYKENEILAFMDEYWGSYFRGELQTWASYLSKDYQNIGTTKEEIWNSKRGIVEYTERVIDQMVGRVETRNKITHVVPYGPYFMVHELGDLHVKAEEAWVFYAHFRLSSLLEKSTDGWKILHQHGSFPDSKADEGEAFGFDEIKVENKKLRDAIHARTVELQEKNRELEIEAALERVRAEAMAMQSTADFEKVTKQLLEQIKKLNMDGFTGASILLIDENELFTWWDFSAPGNFEDPKSLISRYDPHKYTHLGMDVLDKWKNGENYMVFDYDLKKLKAAIKEWEDINPEIANTFREAIAGGHFTHQWNP